MSEDKKHTKLPWKHGYGDGLTGPTTPVPSGPCCGGDDYPYDVVSCGKETIAIVPHQRRGTHGTHKANASLIVKAVNNHYQLLEACKKAEQALDSVWASLADKNMPKTKSQIVKEVAAINKAIANAEATE